MNPERKDKIAVEKTGGKIYDPVVTSRLQGRDLCLPCLGRKVSEQAPDQLRRPAFPGGAKKENGVNR